MNPDTRQFEVVVSRYQDESLDEARERILTEIARLVDEVLAVDSETVKP